MTDAPEQMALRMRGVVAGYSPGDVVLNGVDLEVQPGAVTALLGPNGSGKSTCLRIVYGFGVLHEGRIELGDEAIEGMPTHERLQRGIAFLPQGHSVFPELTVEENLLVGTWVMGSNKEAIGDALNRTYEEYPQLADMAAMPAGSLSGGQQRILEIARMMITDPQLLLVDEPSVGLAPVLVDDVYEEIERLRHAGKTILLVDQNVQAALSLADYVYILEYGENKAEGDAADFSGDVAQIVRDWLRV